MQSQAGIRLRGLREFDQALGKADRNMRSNLRKGLKDVAGDVAVKAQQTADLKGERQTGDMIRSIRPFALTGRAGVRVSATHRGYAYPQRLEYEDRGGAPYGPRAFLNPAVDASTPELERGMERVLDQLQSDFSGGITL
jgi:hypothetical protein